MLRITALMFFMFSVFAYGNTSYRFVGPHHIHTYTHSHDGMGSHSHQYSHDHHSRHGGGNHNHGGVSTLMKWSDHSLRQHTHSHTRTHTHGGFSHSHEATHAHVIGGGTHPAPFRHIDHTPAEAKAIQTGIPVGAERRQPVRSGGGAASVPSVEPDEESESDNVGVAPAASVSRDVVVLTPVVLNPLLVTEYMEADLSRTTAQWIEIYNPNNSNVNLAGYVFKYVKYTSVFKFKIMDVVLDSFSVPAKKAVILTNKRTVIFDNLRSTNSVYVLGISYDFSSGWAIIDPHGNDIHRIGRAFGEGSPKRLFEGRARKSYQRYTNADTESKGYYGHRNDVGNPTYHEFVRAAPAIVRKKAIIWGNLKRDSGLSAK